MSKSKETFNKKEKEKQKQKRKQDKEQKKEERQANSNKGKSFEEMFAYVDENGNLTSTPPDPKNKKIIKQEDIEIGVPKQAAFDAENAIREGTVTFFNDAKGYGFIKDQETRESVFVHVNDLNDKIKENDKVSFEVEMGHKGLNAKDVKLIK